ncbi:MAG: regulatory protein RecX [Solirubrobacterales bacterium]|nr:regulatory protein RecX [Solirubrobacterales bacterium]
MDPQDRELQEALAKAIGALRRRERSSAELHAWLIERCYPAAVAEGAIAELVEIGELDDERFAFAYAADKRDLSGWGAQRIEGALIDRGIGPALAERAAAAPHEEELDRAVGLLLAKGEDLADDGSRTRALSHLTRRGYDYDLAYEAIRQAERAGPRAA